jgi:hypothetical protein
MIQETEQEDSSSAFISKAQVDREDEPRRNPRSFNAIIDERSSNNL